MKFARFSNGGRIGLAAARHGEDFHGRYLDEISEYGDFGAILAAGSGVPGALVESLLNGEAIDLNEVDVLPPLANPGKIICNAILQVVQC